MKKQTTKRLQLNKIIIARLNIPGSKMFWEQENEGPGQSTHPWCDPLRPPTEKTGVATLMQIF